MIPRSTSDRLLIGAAVIVGLVIVFSLVTAMLNRDREPDLLPEGSPGRAVQDFVLAVQREDADAAYALLSEEARGWCGPDDLVPGPGSLRSGESFSIRLVGTEEDGDEAAVTVEVTWVDAPGDIPLLGGSTHSWNTTYRALREQGEWRLRSPRPEGWWCPDKPTPTPTAPVPVTEP